MKGILQVTTTTVSDSTSIQDKAEQVMEMIRTTPAEVLLTDLIESIISFGLKVLAALAIYFVGAWLIRKIKNLLKRGFERRGADAAISSFVQSIVSIALTVLLIIITIGALGIDTTSLAALLAGGGMAIGLALNGTVQNFAGGIMLLIFKPFKAGDFIEVQGLSGTVSEVSITSTKLTTVDNRVIIIPNGSLSNGTINNYSDRPIRRVDLSVNVEYGTPSEKMKELILGILEKDDRILNEPSKPFVALSALNDSGIQFTIRVWVNSADYWNVYFETLEKIYNQLPENGIKFPFPQIDVNIKQDTI